MAKIECLICGKLFDFLPPHLSRGHSITADEYKELFDIPAGMPLASDEYRETGRKRFKQMMADGIITHSHLESAREAAREVKTKLKRGESREIQRRVINKHRPFDKNRIPPGGKRASGKNADREREYQRAYRARKNGDGSLMEKYKIKWGLK